MIQWMMILLKFDILCVATYNISVISKVCEAFWLLKVKIPLSYIRLLFKLIYGVNSLIFPV